MIKTYLRQVWQVVKQNPFFCFVTILSTAVTIAFVMVAYMAYDLNSSDLPPEVNRSRSLYSDMGFAYRTADNGNRDKGMSYKTIKAVTGNLPSAELVSIHGNDAPYTCQAVGDEGSRGRYRGRYAGLEWWKLFQYEFIAGRPFIEEEYEAGKKVVVLTERTARELFNSTDVTGREMLIDFRPYIVCGVVKDVSSQFSNAYADFWANLTASGNVRSYGKGSENVNGFLRFIALAKKGKINELRQEIEANTQAFDASLLETTFELKMNTHNEFTFFNFFNINPVLLYVLLVAIFLVVPAVNISGMISSMLDKRYEEIGIRKAYGASRGEVTRRFLSENLLLVFIGGIIGLLLSVLTIYLFRNWLLGVSLAYAPALTLSWQTLFRPSVFLAAFVVSLLFNLLSTWIPVRHAAGKNIVDTLKN